MIELNNIDFSTLQKTRKLPVDKYHILWTLASSDHANMLEITASAFELGASLAHQEETKKVCALLKPT